MLIGNNKSALAQFSFLMVIPPILGEALLDLIKFTQGVEVTGSITHVAFIADFIDNLIPG